MDDAPRHDHEGARRSRDRAVEVGQGPGRAGRDRVVVDRVGTAGVPVAELDHHPPADRVREYFAVIWSHEAPLVLAIHFRDPICDGLALYTQRRTLSL